MDGSFDTRRQRTVAIHQPNYFPWLGFFYKIYASDVFVFHDNVEHSKRYPTRRTRIRKSKTDAAPIWLTVPLKKHSDYTLMKDLEIDHSQPWQEKHWRKLKNSYSHAPFFPQVCPLVEPWLAASNNFTRLADFNIFLVKSVLGLLGIPTPLHRSSEMSASGSRTERLVELVGGVGGGAYLSGKGGKGYQDEAAFSEKGIRLIYSEFGGWLTENPYPQAQGGRFLGGLSVLDALFNVGTEGVSQLFAGALAAEKIAAENPIA